VIAVLLVLVALCFVVVAVGFVAFRAGTPPHQEPVPAPPIIQPTQSAELSPSPRVS
jgi:hypothetical protein